MQTVNEPVHGALSEMRSKCKKVISMDGETTSLLSKWQRATVLIHEVMGLLDFTQKDIIEEEDLQRFQKAYIKAGVQYEIVFTEADDTGHMRPCTCLIRRVVGVIPQGHKFLVIADYFDSVNGTYLHTLWRDE